MDKDLGANMFSLDELESLFKEDEQATPPAQNDETTTQEQPADDAADEITRTKAFSKRLNESVSKEREKIAKTLGFESYDAMMKEHENKTLTDKGLDPEVASPIIDELVKKRLDEDPRMAELAKLREQQVKEFGKRELDELSKLTDGEITKFEQLPKDVLELWRTTGSLKKAYMQLYGEDLLIKARSANIKGSTNHLANLGGASAPKTNTRPLTDEEKRVWRVFNPSITEEELSKKTINID